MGVDRLAALVAAMPADKGRHCAVFVHAELARLIMAARTLWIAHHLIKGYYTDSRYPIEFKYLGIKIIREINR